MYYLTDFPWPAVILLGGLAVAAFVIGHSTLRNLGVVLGIAAAAVYMVSELVVSNREQVELCANQILNGLQAEDLNAVGKRISKHTPKLNDTAEQGLELVEFKSDFHIQAVDLKSESEREIVAQIRANGNVMARSQSVTQRVAELWETTWIHESGQWKLSRAVRLHPVTRQPRSTFDRS